MVQTKTGARKIAAQICGLTLSKYEQNLKLNLKRCRKCKTWKNKANYNKDKSRYDGLETICDSCRCRRKIFPVTYSERVFMRKHGFIWCLKCDNWTNDRAKDGRCRTHKNLKYNEYYKTRFGKAIRNRVHFRKRKLQKIPLLLQEKLNDFFKNRCAYCRINEGNTWDHIKPVKKNGIFVLGNIVPCCMECNVSKKDQDVVLWVHKKGIKINELEFFLSIANEVMWVC